MALQTKRETVDEIEALARAALSKARSVATPGPVVDTCGTGGDRSGTLNISTLGAIVVARVGVAVAKHGNRAASSCCGSADLLEALGVRIDLGPAGVERRIAEAGIGFMFAPVFHPAAAYAAGIRRELRVPTGIQTSSARSRTRRDPPPRWWACATRGCCPCWPRCWRAVAPGRLSSAARSVEEGAAAAVLARWVEASQTAC